ncbi:NlpC/P60 family protein [Micromonospora sp. NPDC049679]|uniref:C40 family peptidase n=1 Tax=Micromonospora sp. NPDC049679 TaxID=3155920 RepID=UPI0033FE2963
MQQHTSTRPRRFSTRAGRLSLALGVCLCAGQLVAAPAVAAERPVVRAPAAQAPVVPAPLAPRLQLTANARTVGWGGTVALTARITDPRTGQPVRGGTATLQVWNGSRWVNGQTVSVSAGQVRYTPRLTDVSTFRFVFNGHKPVYQGGTSGQLRISVASNGGQVVHEARKLTGKPYRYGASGPHSFDCSGFTRYVYRKAGGKKLPHNANTQQRYGRAVGKSQAKPGDLIVIRSGSYGYHVGVYAGGGYMYDAPRAGQKIGKHKIWTSSYVVRRIVN